MNIDAWQSYVLKGLDNLYTIVKSCNDILENRIHKNLRLIGQRRLLILPNDRSVTLDEFIELEESCIRENAEYLRGKNSEVSCPDV